MKWDGIAREVLITAAAAVVASLVLAWLRARR